MMMSAGSVVSLIAYSRPYAYLLRCEQLTAQARRLSQAMHHARSGSNGVAVSMHRASQRSEGKVMGFLAGKKILVTGVLSTRSIAYGIAQACHREGAELAFTYVGERFRARALALASEFESDRVFECDVTSDSQIDAAMRELGTQWDRLDGLVHAIAFAQQESISGDFLEGLSREAFHLAQDVSAYSFPALCKAALPLFRPGSSVLTLSYLGAVRAMPRYNTMGLAKAALESSVRYLAQSLGRRGVRANAISAGPIRTLASAGFKDFGQLLDFVGEHSPLRRNVTILDVGNVAAFLLSDLAAGMTAQVSYVDAGFSEAMSIDVGVDQTLA
jgi:enoyl-[acyl-carrier protein] reductase I